MATLKHHAQNSADEFSVRLPYQILVSTEVGVRQKLWTLKDTKAFVSLAVIDNRINSLKTHF
jgi:hypothetical protein